MEEFDRQKIIRNLVQLIKETKNHELFYAELISRNVFTSEMMETILSERGSSYQVIQKVFLQVCYRGPDAFKNLVKALRHTGNVPQAQLLDPNCNNNLDSSVEGQRVLTVDSQHQHHIVQLASGINSDNPVQENNNTYEINSRPKGFALIINMIDFDGNPNLKRSGAEVDSTNLKSLLETLEYEVQVVINPKKKDLLCKTSGIITSFINMFSSRVVDSCIVAIMSHGEDNFWIQTSDCERMDDERAHLTNLWEDILPRFNNQNFPMMRNKPKLFIVQACRGDRNLRRVRLSPIPKLGPNLIRTDFGIRNSSENTNFETHPEFNHMMILQSTIPGYVSLRHEELGCPFIQILCQVIEEYGSLHCLADLVSEMAKRLQELPQDDGGPQTCTFKTIGYVRKFNFFNS